MPADPETVIELAAEHAICTSADSKEFDHDGLIRFADVIAQQATYAGRGRIAGWIPVGERLPEAAAFCDWLMPVSDLKRERWILTGESIITASVPGRATHWRPAQDLPEQVP